MIPHRCTLSFLCARAWMYREQCEHHLHSDPFRLDLQPPHLLLLGRAEHHFGYVSDIAECFQPSGVGGHSNKIQRFRHLGLRASNTNHKHKIPETHTLHPKTLNPRARNPKLPRPYGRRNRQGDDSAAAGEPALIFEHARKTWWGWLGCRI